MKRFLKKLDIAVKSSHNCVQVATKSLNTAQKMLEKVEENMRMIAKNECELYYIKTIREVDNKVMSLRSEFNQLLNPVFPPVQGPSQLLNNPSGSHLLNNNHFQYPYNIIPQPNLNIANANNLSTLNTQHINNFKNQAINFGNAPQGNLYALIQNVQQL